MTKIIECRTPETFEHFGIGPLGTHNRQVWPHAWPMTTFTAGRIRSLWRRHSAAVARCEKCNTTAFPLQVAQQCLEAEIHVLLDMAVKQSKSRLVGGKVHAGAPVGGHHDRVLDHAGG